MTRIWQTTLTLDASVSTEHLNAARALLHDRCTRYTTACGYEVHEVSWETHRNRDLVTVTVALVTRLRARTDGEWPALHAAIAEDERDRAEAAEALRAARMAEPISWTEAAPFDR